MAIRRDDLEDSSVEGLWLEILLPKSHAFLVGTIKQHDYLLRKARRTASDEDWANYRTLRNRVTNMIKKVKGAYNRQLLEDNKDNDKAFWRTEKKIIPGEKCQLISLVL